MRARGTVDSQIPLRDYFLWVGGTLLVLLFAADSLLSPPPTKLIKSHSTRPPIRITSDLKRPEAVIIHTSQPTFPPMLPGKEIATAPSPPLSSDVADAVRQPPTSLSEQADASDGNPAISPRVREALAQLGPGASDPGGSSRRWLGLASNSQRNFVQSRSERRQRSARHRRPRCTPIKPPVSLDQALQDLPHVQEAIVSDYRLVSHACCYGRDSRRHPYPFGCRKSRR